MNIFVGSLSYQTTESELEQLFSEFGAVSSAKVIMDNYTNRSRGFGFVEMANNDEAKSAIEKLNGTSFMQQTLVVNEARPKTTGGGGGFNRGGGGGNRGGGGFNRDRDFNRGGDRDFKKKW
jgi:RNA recognition motif-containing protein